MLKISPKEKNYKISSIEEYVDIARQFDRSALYRGVSDSDYQLITSLGRKRLSIGEELKLIHLFDTYASEFNYYNPRDDWEKLIIAQHHGLPTRLMDWSRNALVALYFACLKSEAKEGAVYVFYSDEWLPAGMLEQSPFEIEKVYAFLPSVPTNRVKAQSGVHTIHPNFSEPYTHENMITIKFDGKHKSGFIYDLEKLGIHHASMFPDLDGLTKYIRFIVRGECI